MLNKLHFKFQFRFLKKLCTPLSFTNNTKVPHQLQPFPKSLNFCPMFNFSSSYTQEVFRLENLSTEQRIKMKKIMEKYDTHKQDFAQLTSEDIQWMLSGLSDLSLALQEAHNPYRAKDCLADKAFIFQKLGLKDTIEDALNYYQMAFFFTSHKWYPRRKSDEVEEYLDEVDRICKLLGEDPQTKSLKVQRLFLLAQIASGKSQDDKALELYNTVLKNIDDISESALPTILPNLYQEMGRIYHEKGDIDNMIKSFENTLQVVMKYFGHKSTIDFTFLGDMAQNLDQQSAEDRIKMVLQSFPDPSERSAVICCLIGNIYLANQNLQAVYAYHEAFQIFEKLPKDYSYLLYDVYFSMASALEIDAMMPYFYKDRNKGSTDFLDKAKQALLRANGGEPNLKVADVYMRWATSYKGSDPFAAVSLSSHYRSKALEIYKTLDASNNAKIFSMNLALARIKYFGAQLTFDGYGEENWEKPLKTWKEAEKYLDPADHPSVEEVYMNLSSIYSRLENREESEKCLQKVLQSCEATGDTSYVFNSYHENAEFLEEEGKLKEALENYEIAARVYEKDAKKDHVKAQNLTAKISQIQAKLQMAQ